MESKYTQLILTMHVPCTSHIIVDCTHYFIMACLYHCHHTHHLLRKSQNTTPYAGVSLHIATSMDDGMDYEPSHKASSASLLFLASVWFFSCSYHWQKSAMNNSILNFFPPQPLPLSPHSHQSNWIHITLQSLL